MTPLAGVFAAAATPRRTSGHEVDFGLALEVIDFLSSKAISGITLLGTTGEFVHFDVEARTRFVAHAARRSRVPVLVNVSHSTLDGALTLAQAAESAGVAGLVVMPPYFFRYGQDDLLRFFLAFVEETGVRLPVYLYNIPFFTTPMSVETACALLETGRFAGIKDSSGEWEFIERLLKLRAQGNFTVMVGNDVIFTRARSAGADGVVSGVACALPELMTTLDRAIAAGNHAKAGQLQRRLAEFLGWADSFPAPVGVREALALRGLKAGPAAVPPGAELARRLDDFRAWFRGWWPGVERELLSG